jgi:hypothetical protein
VGRLPSGALAEPEPTVETTRVMRAGGATCVPARTDDDRIRCLPAPAEAVRAWPRVYADAGCTTRAAQVPPGAAAPAEVTLLDDTFAEVPQGRVYIVGRPLPSSSVFTDRGDGRCVLVAELGLPSSDTYGLSPGASLDRFPELSLEVR